MKKRGKEKLPRWKAKVNSFNRSRLEWLEKIVKKAIPWLVLLLLFIIIGEFAEGINSLIAKMIGHETHFMELVAEFFHEYHVEVLFLDHLIIWFFVIDLYFNFFKTPTMGLFLKRYFLDLIAVTPVGLFFRGSEAASLAGEIGLGQEVTHVATEAERTIVEAERTAKAVTEAERTAKAVSEAERTTKAVTEAERATKAARLTRAARTARIASRAPRAARIMRLRDFAKKKPVKKNKKKR